ncbi:MAG: type I-E CRISPR-associated protein Cse2/CasB [Eubacteriales bacterium]|nr:type I-E CRISPR-associated protein Cse2/CasB [Eubacteriales bacterium]
MQNEMLQVLGKPALAGRYVARKLQQLQNSGNEPLTRASLARLRRGLGKPPGSMPDLWDLTLEGMPQELAGFDGQPSWGEWAIHLALTLFALHQQGKNWKTDGMNKPGQALGKAARQLVKNEDDMARVKRRFDQAITSDSPQEVARHLRSLVQLLRASGIALDYPALAEDLYRYQIPEARDGVRLKWGRDFFAATFTNQSPNAPEIEDDLTESEEMDHDE